LLVADPARVVVDSLDDPSLIGGTRHGAEVVTAYLAEHSPTTLIEYGDHLGNSAVFKRLGYIAERAHLDADDLVAECASRIASGISMLDPTGPPTGERDSMWGLRINVTISPDEAS
jgi:predicted transcriptional regulator of viral defense system